MCNLLEYYNNITVLKCYGPYSVKNGTALKSLGENSRNQRWQPRKGCNDVNVLMLTNLAVSINIIAAISWPSPLISQLFSPWLFKAAPFFTAWLFLCG